MAKHWVTFIKISEVLLYVFYANSNDFSHFKNLLIADISYP